MADELTVDFRDQFQFGDVVRTCAKIDGKVLFGAVTVLGGLERCFDEFVYRRIVRFCIGKMISAILGIFSF